MNIPVREYLAAVLPGLNNISNALGRKTQSTSRISDEQQLEQRHRVQRRTPVVGAI
jgi:hypothetical protein